MNSYAITPELPENPRRVLMTSDAVGGVFTYSLDLSSALAARGVEVALAIMGRAASPGQRREAEKIQNLALFERPCALEWMDDPWTDVDRAGEWLLEVERLVRPDVIHSNGFAHGALAWSAPCMVVAHSSVTAWWRAVFREPAPAKYDEYRRRVRAGLQAATLVVAPSRTALRDLEFDFGPLLHAIVIPNGTRIGRFAPAKKEPFFFASGRLWDAAKNVSTLASIAHRLPWPVKVAGDVSAPGGRAVELSGSAAMLGHLSPELLSAKMSRAAVFVHPARYEPFGLAPLEAALSECALVLGDIESLRELWDGAACFVPPDDPEGLVSACSRLATDSNRRALFGAAARARALHFSAERTADGYVRAYRLLLYEQRARRVERCASSSAQVAEGLP